MLALNTPPVREKSPSISRIVSPALYVPSAILKLPVLDTVLCCDIVPVYPELIVIDDITPPKLASIVELVVVVLSKYYL